MSKQQGANPRARRSAGRRRSSWPLVVAVVILGGAALGVVLGFEVATRTSPDASASTSIVGKWVNAKGGELDFHADGTGYIPAGADIAASYFTYFIQDATHLVMKVAGSTITIEIKLVDDKLTWYTADPNVKYEYTRVK